MLPPVAISLIEPPPQASLGRRFVLRAEIASPGGKQDAVRVHGFKVLDGRRADIDTSMVPRELTLSAGERCLVSFDVAIHEPGSFNTSVIEFQVSPINGPDHLRTLLLLPAHEIRVLPALIDEIEITSTRICSYGTAAKIEIQLRHVGTFALSHVEWELTPADRIRAGITHRRLSSLNCGEILRDELVVTGDRLDVRLKATCNGERVEISRTLSVANGSGGDGEPAEFRFLEPRNFTRDTITIKPEKDVHDVVAIGGVFPVYGGKSRYEVTILPTHPNATSVNLLPAAGRVEVTAVPRAGRASPFVITVLDNPTLRQTVRLDYTVMVEGQPFQGEIYLSIRPTNSKLWMVAITAGLALTAKGLLGLGPALFRPDSSDESLIEHLAGLLEARWSDLIQMLSILVIRTGLWVIDLVMRQFEDF